MPTLRVGGWVVGLQDVPLDPGRDDATSGNSSFLTEDTPAIDDTADSVHRHPAALPSDEEVARFGAAKEKKGALAAGISIFNK